ncbi:myosin heavy chain, clone 203-like [Montipora foliosa]|uniref:myosin heavy chain, clone 203-like n=1 Tax=Montipora foliosa TaxID=591990 RepID=UPI0035F1371F
MAEEGQKDMSIVEHDVLQVYEVQEGALQECMMFVKKLSETSLRDLETEKNNLNGLLKEAEKEVTILKTSVKTANSNVEELTATMKAEMQQRQKLEDLFEAAKVRADELNTELNKSKESISALKKLNQEKSDTLMRAEETAAKLKAEKDFFAKELENVQLLRSRDEKETDAIHKRLVKEQEKTFRIEEQLEEVAAQLNKEIDEAKKRLSLQKEQADAEVAQLRQKLDLEQKMNESLSSEADICLNDIKKQLVILSRENSEMQSSKETLLERLRIAEEEISTLRRKLNEEKQSREKLYQENKEDLHEAKRKLERIGSENDCLVSEKESVEGRLRSLQGKHEGLLGRTMELQESLQAAENKVVSLEEQIEAMKTSSKSENEESKEHVESWAKRVEEVEDWQQKYRELEIEQEALYRQFTQVRKHRNRVLRENGGLRRQMSMAGAQLAVTNQKFQRQLQHFRTQLNMAEHLYREKMLECSILEVQLKHLLKSSPSAQQTYDYGTNSEEQGRDYFNRSLEVSHRHDYSASRPIRKFMQQARSQYVHKQRVQPNQQAEQDNCPESSTSELT